MEKNPYTFDTKNHRLVTGVEAPTTKIYLASGVIFLGALHLYNRKFFRIDGSLGNLALFAGLAAPASYTYSNFLLSDSVLEAGQLNNRRENNA